jgi:phosphatidylserine/phosphatidylglycerophosphate/cardiolipin synthase-like enzyme
MLKVFSKEREKGDKHFENKHAIAHGEVMIIDGEAVITGSFNFTKDA